MELSELLFEKKAAILEKWIDYALSDFHDDASKFFKKPKDPFANPLGHTTVQSLTKIFDILCKDCLTEEAASIIEDYVKMRAIQEVTPSQAVSFIYELKKIIRKECLSKEKGPSDLHMQMSNLESRIDEMALLVFDFYMQSRERLYKVRINEFKRGTHILTDGAVCPSALMRQKNEQKYIKPF